MNRPTLTEFAEQFASANNLELHPHQKRILEAIEKGERIIISYPRPYGRRALETIIKDYAKRKENTLRDNASDVLRKA
jgi:MinD-like ATPase involved in chromosome partitioning or flagellar assembly